MKFSVVMPIHYSDGKFLSTTLPSVYRLEPDEIILVFDKRAVETACVRARYVHVVETAKALIRKGGYEKRTRLIEIGDTVNWSSRIAYLRVMGFLAASNRVILNTDADTILDPKIKEDLNLIGHDGIAMISFRRLEFPLSLQFFVHRLLLVFHLEESFSPIYAFDKNTWLATEDFELMRQVPQQSDDVHFHLLISKGHKVLFKEVRCVHLKPVLTKERKYSEGKALWQVKRNPFWKILARSIVYLDVEFMMGYIHERWHRKN